MKIWVYLNDAQQGPYTPEELAALPITGSTPVWYQGLERWTAAAQAPLTAHLFNAVTPARRPPREPQATAPGTHTAPHDLPPAPPTFIGWSVFLLLCCFPIGGLLGIVFSSMSSSAYAHANYQRAARLSSYAEWTVIISIVLGLLASPLAIIFL